MTDFIDVVEHNPIVFVKKVVEAIQDGYSIQNTIPGYPYFDPYGNHVRMFKADKPEGVVIPADSNGVVAQYDPMGFMLLLQNFIHAGYTFDENNGQHFFDQKGLKSVKLDFPEKAEEKKEDKKAEEPVKEKQAEVKKPAKGKQAKAPAKKALSAEPTKEELEADNVETE